jgi:hypothetical protein
MWGVSISSITKALSWFLGNPLLAEVIASLIQLFKDNQDEIFTQAVNLVEKTWKADISGPEKMLLIKTELMSKFPDVKQNIIDTAAQVAFNFIKNKIGG